MRGKNEKGQRLIQDLESTKFEGMKVEKTKQATGGKGGERRTCWEEDSSRVGLLSLSHDSLNDVRNSRAGPDTDNL